MRREHLAANLVTWQAVHTIKFSGLLFFFRIFPGHILFFLTSFSVILFFFGHPFRSPFFFRIFCGHIFFFLTSFLRAERLPPVPEDEVAALVQPICSRSAADPRAPARRRHWAGAPRLLHLDFLLAWLGQQVQDPAHHTHVIVVLQGLHGVGKNIIFDFFRDAVMGPRVAFKSSNPSKDIFGTHSVALRDRVFVNLDELSGEEIRPLMSRLKDLVTSSTVHVNPKNQPAYDVRNQANIFATSNQMNPIHVEPQERRIVVFACNGSKKGDTAYFGRLLAHLNGAKRDAVARAFYQYLRDNVEVAPFLPFQAVSGAPPAHGCLRREREIGVCRSRTRRSRTRRSRTRRSRTRRSWWPCVPSLRPAATAVRLRGAAWCCVVLRGA